MTTLLSLFLGRAVSPDTKDTGTIVGVIIGVTAIIIVIELFTASQILAALRDLTHALVHTP